MAWECPECKRAAPNKLEQCMCGYNRVTQLNELGFKAMQIRSGYTNDKDAWTIDTKSGYVREYGISNSLWEQRFHEVPN